MDITSNSDEGLSLLESLNYVKPTRTVLLGQFDQFFFETFVFSGQSRCQEVPESDPDRLPEGHHHHGHRDHRPHRECLHIPVRDQPPSPRLSSLEPGSLLLFATFYPSAGTVLTSNNKPANERIQGSLCSHPKSIKGLISAKLVVSALC